MDLDVGAYELALAVERRKKPGSLRRGKESPKAVRALQERLSDLGYAVSTDGVFGPETERAVREFQRSRGAKNDGVVGQQTLGKLKRATRAEGNPADPSLDAITQVVTKESRDELRERRRAAKERRADSRAGGSTEGRGKARKTPRGPNGGLIDPETGKERASASTGPIGSTQLPKTKGVVWEGGAKEDPLADDKDYSQGLQQNNNPEFNKKHARAGGKFAAKGDSGPEVQNAQAALNKTAKSGLKEDGEFGPKTDAAVRTYQRTAKLTVDGIIGPKTAASLRRRLKLVEKLNKG